MHELGGDIRREGVELLLDGRRNHDVDMGIVPLPCGQGELGDHVVHIGGIVTGRDTNDLVSIVVDLAARHSQGGGRRRESQTRKHRLHDAKIMSSIYIYV